MSNKSVVEKKIQKNKKNEKYLKNKKGKLCIEIICLRVVYMCMLIYRTGTCSGNEFKKTQNAY